MVSARRGQGGGCLGLIATNTIGQGDTRESGLRWLLEHGGTIRHATRRLPWPGEAAVVVSVVQVQRGVAAEAARPMLDGRPVRRISAYLVEGDLDASPARLAENAGKAFQGAYVPAGDGLHLRRRGGGARQAGEPRLGDAPAYIQGSP